MNEFDVNDMALEEETKGKGEDLDMSLETLSPVAIGARIAKLFPDEDIIKVDEKSELLKMASGDYRFNETALKDLTVEELSKVEDFLKDKGKA